MNSEPLHDASMIDLFRMEVLLQSQVLSDGLLALERDPRAARHLEACMRAAHSLKGAARIVGLEAPVRVAHVMEDCFVAAQAATKPLSRGDIDLLLRGTDLLRNMPSADPANDDAEAHAFVQLLEAHAPTMDAPDATPSRSDKAIRDADEAVAPDDAITDATVAMASDDAARNTGERDLRVSARTLDDLLGLSSETLVEANRLAPFAASLLPLKRMQDSLAKLLESLQHQDETQDTGQLFARARQQAAACQQLLGERMAQADQFGWRIGELGQRLYDTALACRMRPFGDAVTTLPRMVRDLARDLGKQARLEIVGCDTRVDRDILERLEAPMTQLLRNAVDHGIELPAERRAGGKPAEGVVTLHARHSAGMLLVEVSDDGCGIELETLRNEIVRRGLAAAHTAQALSETEALAFLFLPGFTTRSAVTEISGRGVGLDVVHDMARQLRGTARIHQRTGMGTRFTLELPLSLSVMRSLIVDIGAERYAFPLAYVTRAVQIERATIDQLEGRQHFLHEGRQIGLVAATQVLQYAARSDMGERVPVVLLDDAQGRRFGVAVDRFVAEQTLVVQPLDPRLGKLQDIQAGAVMEDGTPVLILDVEDLLRSVEKLASSGALQRVGNDAVAAAPARPRRILVVDDSLTVRELERKLLANRGYDVAVAVDGVDGWNMLRAQDFDLLVTDVDMPRMDGIELVTQVRKDPGLQSMHVMVVSYKDRPEDRQRGLDAGADYYLGKSSFHDDALLQAVEDLIGRATT